MASQRIWWAGVSYGPRLYTDVVPILVLLGVIGLDAALRRDHGRDWQWKYLMRPRLENLKLLGAAIFIVCGILINGAGAVHGRWAHWDRAAYRAKYRPISTFLDWSKPTIHVRTSAGEILSDSG